MPVKTRQTFTDRSTVSLAAGQSDTVQVRVADIRIDGGTQMRAMYNDEALEDYAGALEAGDRLPPIVVYFDGSEYWLADGFHRVEAQKRAHGEEAEIEASVKSGTRREAILHAAQANADHGLRRTNADKRRAVETLLRDGEWSQWSDREIARRCKVDHKTVGNLRQELSEEIPQIDAPRTVERGGQTYTMNTGGIRKANERRAKPPESSYTESQHPETPQETETVAESEEIAKQDEVGKLSITVTLRLDRGVAEQLHAAVLVGALRFNLDHQALVQLEQSLKEVLS